MNRLRCNTTAFGLLLAACATTLGGGERPQVPVLLELFTSEGCSSCPPADRLLEKFDRDQPVAGADVIVLSEHVDYWNSLGWKDPFSSAQFSERQQQYANALRGSVYTPELVVDGVKGFVGSEQSEAIDAVKNAIRAPKIPMQVTAEKQDNKAKVTVHVDAGADGTVWLALAHDREQSQVLRGENGGHNLAHVGVVYSLEQIGKSTNAGGFDKEMTVTLKPGLKNQNTRIVAFVAKGGSFKVVGAAQARL